MNQDDQYMDPTDEVHNEIPISKHEINQLMKSSLLAAYAVGGIFVLGFFLFLLFCMFIWF